MPLLKTLSVGLFSLVQCKKSPLIRKKFEKAGRGDTLTLLFAFYYDLPFEETLRRHETKPDKADFGEQDMRRWWKENDFVHIIPEKILTKNLSVSDTVEMIYNFVS